MNYRAILFSSVLTGCFSDCHTYNCYDPTTENDVYAKIKVDNASFNYDTVNITDTLRLSFSGTIGNDSCYSFAYFHDTRVPMQSDIELWSKHKEVRSYGQNVPCVSATITLNGVYYNYYNLNSGNFTVMIHEPDGSQLMKTAYVR